MINKTLLFGFLASVFAGCQEAYVPVQTFAEAEDPITLTAEQEAVWGKVNKALDGGWACPNVHFSRSIVPQTLGVEKFAVSAWRGEKASAQIMLWTSEGANGVACKIADFKSAEGRLPSSIGQARFVRYTFADNHLTGKEVKPTSLEPDMLDSLARFDMQARTARPVWITVNVPQDAKPGVYTSGVVISHNGSGKITLPLELKVLNHTLPTPDKWEYHLDLWQHPSAVARAHGLEMWSDAHFDLLKETMSMLANAGQKVITATLNKDPWNHQCYDAYDDMIKWTLHKDGTWSYDYKVFDRWVDLMLSLKIDKMINCYSMVPWNCELDYMDEAAGKKVTVVAEPGKPMFTKMWEPFLKDFKKHLEAKGWLGITNIAMDERSPEAMDAAVKLLDKCAPEMGFAIADNHKSYRKYKTMRDVCVAQQQKADHKDILTRRAEGYNTTFYVCCGPLFPNTFTFSQPYEAELLGWYKTVADYDGMLRWAYNSWPDAVEFDSRYGSWSAGDTYLVYPYLRSSIRFERLIDGIENAEKVRILREEGANLDELNKVLDEMRGMNINDGSLPWMKMMLKADKALNAI